MEEQFRCPFCYAHIRDRRANCIECGQEIPKRLLISIYDKELESAGSYDSEQRKALVRAYAVELGETLEPDVPERVCPFCGAKLDKDADFCPACRRDVLDLKAQPIPEQSALPSEVKTDPETDSSPKVALSKQSAEKIITQPKTIAELKLYCAQKGMRLDRMRFFIGENYRSPRAFGIYRSGDNFIVYKNKDNGERAVRYNGPNESFAVNELFQKILSECHLRGIYPDGKPENKYTYTPLFRDESEKLAQARARNYRKVSDPRNVIFRIILIIIFVMFIYITVKTNGKACVDCSEFMGGSSGSRSYRGGYYSSSSHSSWWDDDDDDDWGGSDYDSWDSDDTDWDSDW